MDFLPQTLFQPSSAQFFTLAVFIAIAISFYASKGPNLSHIPTAGSRGLISYFDNYLFLFRAQDVLQEGYDKFQRGLGAFKVATPNKWTVFLTTPQLINEMRLARDDEISITASNLELLRGEYTLGLREDVNEYHNKVVQSALTRNLATKLDEIHDEVVRCFEELIPTSDDDWRVVPVKTTIQVIACRAVNRFILGESLGTHPEWIDLNIQFSVSVVTTGIFINAFPRFLYPVIGPLLSPLPKAMRTSRKVLKDEIERRIQMHDEFGKKYDGRPNDLISWLLEVAPKEERTVDKIILRLLIVNMGAVHTVANAFTQTLFNLLAEPKHIAPLREEVRLVVEKRGWTKAALNEMIKLDSVLRETNRFQGLSVATMGRKIVKPSGYTFANGLHLPCGTHISVPAYEIHRDKQNYDDPHTFDGFRFSKTRALDGEHTKHQMVTTSLNFLPFGHGKHACPGRFLAVAELKIMLAHLLMTYDIAVEEGNKPHCIRFGVHTPPDPTAKVLFRRSRDRLSA